MFRSGSINDAVTAFVWYCMRSAVNVMGGFTIKVACDAKFAMIGEGAVVLGGSSEGNTGTTVMGGTQVERNC